MTDFFNLHEELLKLQDANYFFQNEVSIKDLDALELDGMLNDTTDKICENSSSITNAELFDTMRSFVKNFNELKSATMNRVLDIILSGFQAEYEITSNDLDADEEETYSEHRTALEMYGFLLVWLISNAENKADSKSGANGTMAMTGGKTKRQRQTKSKTSTVNLSDEWDWSAQKPVTLSLMVKVLELKIKKIWTSTHERDTFVSLFTKSAYRILENVTNTKDSAIKKIVYQILSVCVKDHNHAFGAQTSIMQNLQYYEHLAEPMAEFLDVLANQYDHTRLTEEILIEISNKEFGSQDIIGPKSFSKFLVKLSELVPKVVAKQIGLLVKLLDNESYTMRIGLIEVLGNLIIDFASQEEQATNSISQINGFFDALDERFTEVGAESSTSLLSEDDNQSEDMDVDMPDLSNQQNSSANEIMRLQLTRRYYSDAVRFIHQIHTAVPTLCQLLGSTTKSEVLETMEFFVTAYTYKMEFAIDGIKRMLHLIWIKDNNDEGKGIRKRLIESYYKLYIETDISLSSREAVNAVTKNLISLTYNATLAELTSLEQLMSTMMAEELISNDVIAKLWSVYSVSTKQIPKMQRRGAIIVTDHNEIGLK
ncbi:non-SMC mitotic condensation complex subunit 1 [Gigaspora rosea]|uniref:Non-SMC mitotic condensation complex subunit 1 n=1 Tax=Gigaspora rosea TaxID=44941 RepID=A0A397UZX1_9GLOM|nr:non-SMC mitotic condensation complex subunit 1 [Gigaspora rosea]